MSSIFSWDGEDDSAKAIEICEDKIKDISIAAHMLVIETCISNKNLQLFRDILRERPDLDLNGKDEVLFDYVQ